jgi:hypothetical protein
VYELDEQFHRRKLAPPFATAKSSLCTNWNDRVLPFFLRSQGLITPPLVQKTGYGAFLFFAAFGLSSGLWVWYFVPETKQVPLSSSCHEERIQAYISLCLQITLHLVRLGYA